MLATSKLVGFIPIREAAAARSFYEGKLGLEFVSDDPFAMVLKSGETQIRLVKGAKSPPAPYTILGWDVSDIVAVAKWLGGRGVVFEDYPFIQDRELRIWTAPSGDQVAWFKDPDGNVLSISQPARR